MDKTFYKTQYTTIRDVINPERAHPTDAGVDLFVPELTKDYLDVLISKNSNLDEWTNERWKSSNGYEFIIKIKPHGKINLPSGIKLDIGDKDSFIEIKNKSGIASKTGLVIGACVIDANYQGEIHINLLNTSDREVILHSGQKIAQAVQIPLIRTQWNKISNEEYDQIGKTDRNSGGFGSTGN